MISYDMQKEQIEPNKNTTSVTNLKYFCKPCERNCCKKSNYERHLKTQKHQLMQENAPEIEQKDRYMCKCGKVYKYNAGLWAHKKKCCLGDQKVDSSSIEKLTTIVLTIMSKQVETQHQLNEFMTSQNKLITNIATDVKTVKSSAVTVTSAANSDTLSKRTFLFEECKNAITVSEFIKSIKYSIQDLEWVGKYGYVDGITRIIMNELKSTTSIKRPIWCTDEKRESIYIKLNDGWEKDTPELTHTKDMIFQISNKYYSSLIEWQLKYPGCKESNHPKNDEYLSMIYQLFGGKNGYDIEINKVIKNIIKQISISKSK